MNNNNSYNIKELKEELKEYSKNLKIKIKIDDKDIQLDTFNPKEHEEFKTSFEKIKVINDEIKSLLNKKEIKNNIGTENYIKYLKNILHIKVNKDIKLLKLFKAVTGITDDIIKIIKNIQLISCNKKIKKQLNQLRNLSSIKSTITSNSISNSQLNNCNKKIANNLKTLINTVTVINQKQNGGVNKGFKELKTNNDKEEYKTKLNEIKTIYENGLKQNIQDFKTICKALTEYLNNLFKIILDLLKPKSKPQPQPQPHQLQSKPKPPQPQKNTNEDALKKIKKIEDLKEKIKKLKEKKMSELEQIRPILHKLEKDLSYIENKMKENDKKKEEYINEIKSKENKNSPQKNALRSLISIKEDELEELLFNLDVKLKRLGIYIENDKFLKIIKSGDHKNMNRLIEYIKDTEKEKNQQEEEIKDKEIDNLQDYLNILNKILSNSNNNSKKTSSIRRYSAPEISSQESKPFRQRALSNITQIDKERTKYLEHLKENKSIIYAEIIAKIELLIENLNNEIKENNTPKSDEILNNIMVIINGYDLIEKLDIEYKESRKINDQIEQKKIEVTELLQGITIERQNDEETLKLMINIKQILLKYVRIKINIHEILFQLEENLEQEGNLEQEDLLNKLKTEYKESEKIDNDENIFKKKLSHKINIFKNEMAEFEDLETSWNEMKSQINNN